MEAGERQSSSFPLPGTVFHIQRSDSIVADRLVASISVFFQRAGQVIARHYLPLYATITSKSVIFPD